MEYVRRPPGATEDALRAVEHKYAVALPTELRQFWLESDGPVMWFGYKELQFLRLAEVLEDPYRVAEYMPGGLPICMDGCGNICVAQITSGEVSGYVVVPCGDLGWDSASRLSSSLWGLLRDGKSPEERLDA